MKREKFIVTALTLEVAAADGTVIQPSGERIFLHRSMGSAFTWRPFRSQAHECDSHIAALALSKLHRASADPQYRPQPETIEVMSFVPLLTPLILPRYGPEEPPHDGDVVMFAMWTRSAIDPHKEAANVVVGYFNAEENEFTFGGYRHNAIDPEYVLWWTNMPTGDA